MLPTAATTPVSSRRHACGPVGPVRHVRLSCQRALVSAGRRKRTARRGARHGPTSPRVALRPTDTVNSGRDEGAGGAAPGHFQAAMSGIARTFARISVASGRRGAPVRSVARGAARAGLPRGALPRSAARLPARQARRMCAALAAAGDADAYCFQRATRCVERLVEGSEDQAIPITVVTADTLEAVKSSASPLALSLLSLADFKGKTGECCVIPDDKGSAAQVYLGADSSTDIWSYAVLPGKLPPGTYVCEGLSGGDGTAAALGWALGCYKFDRYKKPGAKDGEPKAALVWPEGCSRDVVEAVSSGIAFARDMVTTPAEDMGPHHIAAELNALAKEHGASYREVVGDDLLVQGENYYPSVHTVGRAGPVPPRVVDLRWAPSGKDAASLPRVTLVGKGVAFDTGGLDIKPGGAMKLMKKDMGGAALVAGLAHAIMSTNLAVNLRVMVPTVENSVSSWSFRPLDVLQTRAGITVENGNTDAEGRLILSDCIWDAAQENPDLLIDAATLTGAARVALGTEMPALFATCQETAGHLLRAGEAEADPLWQLPLVDKYRKMIDSKVADIGSCSEGGYGGAITAALFLREFVPADKAPRWLHIDTMGYTLGQWAQPGKPEGGEALGLRALYRMLLERYGR
ncbi:unnamed protein product [Pedinophyceae sp. YPF-701]|nr:unnamed protein product [Pedinophyceae sp. YPF-701]